MSVLYLHSDRELELRLDGPALVVRKAGEAARLFPLRKLERICLPRNLEVSSQVLVACARAGVTLCFCDARRTPLAWLLPASGEGALAALLERFLGRSDWEGEFNQWHRRQMQRIFRQLGRGMKGIDPEDPAAVERELVRRAIRHAGEADHLNTVRWLTTEAEGLLAGRLSTRGLEAESVPAWSTRLAPLLRWSAEGARLHWLARRHSHHRNRGLDVPPLSGEAFNEFLQGEARALPEAAEALLERFELWLQEGERED